MKTKLLKKLRKRFIIFETMEDRYPYHVLDLKNRRVLWVNIIEMINEVTDDNYFKMLDERQFNRELRKIKQKQK